MIKKRAYTFQRRDIVIVYRMNIKALSQSKILHLLISTLQHFIHSTGQGDTRIASLYQTACLHELRRGKNDTLDDA